MRQLIFQSYDSIQFNSQSILSTLIAFFVFALILKLSFDFLNQFSLKYSCVDAKIVDKKIKSFNSSNQTLCLNGQSCAIKSQNNLSYYILLEYNGKQVWKKINESFYQHMNLNDYVHIQCAKKRFTNSFIFSNFVKN